MGHGYARHALFALSDASGKKQSLAFTLAVASHRVVATSSDRHHSDPDPIPH